MKAYDSVRWDFLLAIFQMIVFPSPMVNWISECVSTAIFSVSINEELHGFFSGSTWLRQGDPLSPYLFDLAIEVLSGLMGQMARHNDFKFHWLCERKEITHLIFSNDLMIFFVKQMWPRSHWLGIVLINFRLLQVYLQMLIRVVCFCVVLNLILSCSFLVLSAIGKGNRHLGILVFLLLLQRYPLMIV